MYLGEPAIITIMSQMETFKLIVTPTSNCIEVLKYLNDCITDINKMGVRVHVEKISQKDFDKDMVELLRKRGIIRLPALITTEGKSFIGIKNITNLFERNLKLLRNGARLDTNGGGGSGGGIGENYGGPSNTEVGTNPELADFWMSEMYGGRDPKGNLIARKDADEGDKDADDIDAKMRAYHNKVPKHRGGGGGQERDIEPAPRPRRRRAQAQEDDDPPPTRGRGRARDEHPEDNIEDEGYDDTPTRVPIRAPVLQPSGEGGDDLDQKMLAAWMDNNEN